MTVSFFFQDQGTDSTIDYSRMVNNVRAQCARNENPPKPEPVRTTSTGVKRVRANYLNSRKISLTCHSIRTAEPTGSTTHQQSKAERHLLDPGRKSGGRLRSPLPSPIPSPVQSPIPSPSRNRFQVSRVQETSSAGASVSSATSLAGGRRATSSATTSPMTPPSSNSGSPTGFFPNPKSRFRVTTVVEPPSLSTLTKHKSLPENLLNTNSTPPNIAVSTNTSPASTTNIRTPTDTTATTSTTTTTKEPSFGLSFKEESTQPLNLSLSYSKSQPELRTPTLLLPSQPNTTIPSVTVMATLPPLLSSFDSPDLEVKRYMDDSCSSISSMDSIDHRDFINTSMSSIESFDMVSGGDSTVISTGPSITPSSIRVQEQQHQQHPIPIFIDQSRCCGRLETVDNESTTSQKIHDSLSSLDTSSSSDSMYSGTRDKLSMPVVPLQSVVCSSNEGTLTNSPVGPCSICIDSNNDAIASSGSSPVHKENCSPSGDSSVASLSPVKQEKRIRKTSWINPMSMKGDNGYPATLDKLISLFHHPSTIFNRQSSKSAVTADESSDKKDGLSPQSQLQQQEDKPPSRKESPMGGLFAWTTMGHRKDAAADDPHNTEQHLHVPIKNSQETSKKFPLQPNCSPENSITLSSNPVYNELASTSQIHATIVSVPERLHKEMKENISPEHTITTASVVSVKSQAVVTALPTPPVHLTPQLLHQQHVEDAAALATSCAERVHFELGGDDDDDDDQNDEDFNKDEQDDDDDGLEKRIGARLSTSSLPTVPIRYPSTTAGNSADSSAGSSHGRMASGLGQITRDSLSIINGTSKNSQDSMRSLESLSEIDNNVFK